jgi:hypothetical protein
MQKTACKGYLAFFCEVWWLWGVVFSFSFGKYAVFAKCPIAGRPEMCMGIVCLRHFGVLNLLHA